MEFQLWWGLLWDIYLLFLPLLSLLGSEQFSLAVLDQFGFDCVGQGHIHTETPEAVASVNYQMPLNLSFLS